MSESEQPSVKQPENQPPALPWRWVFFWLLVGFLGVSLLAWKLWQGFEEGMRGLGHSSRIAISVRIDCG
jgi:hypothetical protein